MSRCDQKQGLLGYCKKESMHPGDHYNGKIRWPRTGIDQEKYLDHLDFMQDIELQVQASADRFRAEHYQLIENQERRDREQQQRQLADTGRRLVGGYNPATTDFARRELEKLVGRRGPACLLAMIPDPGMAEPGWIAWMAVPSWEHSPITAARVSADAPPGWRARAAAWDAAMPNELWIHVRDLFASAGAVRAAWPRTAVTPKSESPSTTAGPSGIWSARRPQSLTPPTAACGRCPDLRVETTRKRNRATWQT